MNETMIVGGCSFTVGHELSDYDRNKLPSKKTWAYGLFEQLQGNPKYVNVARAGSGNSGIARRVFDALDYENNENKLVVVMWSFLSRYDWALAPNRILEKSKSGVERWASITPWDTNHGQAEAFRTLANSEPEQEGWKNRRQDMKKANVSNFAEALYRYGANQYHEVYLSWKSIIWLQNILEKKKIPFMFTLADNTLFYNEMVRHCEQDTLMKALYNEIDFTKWFSFGERMMGFNQWALLNDYERGVTHPLDKAHQDAVQLMQEQFKKTTGGKNV